MRVNSLRVSNRFNDAGRSRSRAVLALAALVAAGCGDDGESGELSYYKDIKPILDAKCASCHYPGGIAPFALESYDDATGYSGVIRLAIEDGTMPPWHANPECNDYVAVRALDDAHKAAIFAWMDAGMPEGDPADEGPPLAVETTTLSRVDSTLSMPEPYTPVPAAGESDDYRCFIVPWPETTTRYVTGFRAVPGNLTVAHHAIAFLAQPGDAALYQDLDAAEAGPGWRCFGGTGGPAREWVGAWAPGNDGADLPAGVGLEIPPGSLIILQMHYNTINLLGGAPEPDLTRLEFRLEDSVAKTGRILPWANPQWVFGNTMTIPPNDPDVVHSFAFDPTIVPFGGADAMTVYGAGAHMHLLGTSARLSIERSDGTSSCLLQIDAWDFDWQGDHVLRAPETLQSGDQLRVECHWDNTAENQPLVGGERLPPSEVNWGEGSTDEMCLGIFLVTVE